MNTLIFDPIKNAAYHEAGHAVMAYQVGWWVHYVEIGRLGQNTRDLTAIEYPDSDSSAQRKVCVSCAGWLSSWKYDQNGKQWVSNESLHSYIQDFHSGNFNDEYDDGSGGDHAYSIRTILRERQSLEKSLSSQEIIQNFQEYERKAWEQIEDEVFWSKVEKVADALLKKSRIEREEVESLIRILSHQEQIEQFTA